MPQTPAQNNQRMSVRIATEDKSLLIRAASLQHTNLTDFVIRTVVAAAREVIEHNDRIELTARDSLQVLDLLDNPPRPNKKLMAAAFALPKKP